ncbi:MAG: hypothetical protein OQJ98_02890 [Candidatus Pacebacteria bacterium]|nr:hypothetical protein [Candidatus Paceibacterota bacterium]
MIDKMQREKPGWLLEFIDTDEASRLTAIPKETLITMRSRGGGPPFTRPAGTRLVRYIRVHIFDWMLSGGVKLNTADGGLIPMPRLAPEFTPIGPTESDG